MDHNTCSIHGTNLRPHLCNECASCGAQLRVLRVEECDRGRLRLVRNERGVVSALLVGQPLDISKMSPYWD